MDEKFDVVFCYHVSPITMLYPAVIAKKRWNMPMITYNLGIWKECAQVFTKSDNGLVYSLKTKLYSNLYRQNDIALVTSKPFISYLNRVDRVDMDKLRYFPQHASTGMLDLDLSSEDNGMMDFVFAGNFGRGNDWM